MDAAATLLARQRRRLDRHCPPSTSTGTLELAGPVTIVLPGNLGRPGTYTSVLEYGASPATGQP